MKLGDVYINKKDKSIIQIDSYATHMGNFPEKSIVVLDKWKGIMYMKLVAFLVLMDMDHEKKLNQNMNY